MDTLSLTAQRLRCSLHEVNGREAGGLAIDERAEDGDAEFFHGIKMNSGQRRGILLQTLPRSVASERPFSPLSAGVS